jgi:hypothetical protein
LATCRLAVMPPPPLLLLLQFNGTGKNNENYNAHGQLVYTDPWGHMECESDKCKATELCKVSRVTPDCGDSVLTARNNCCNILLTSGRCLMRQAWAEPKLVRKHHE